MIDQLKHALSWALGLGLEAKDLNAGHMSLRAVVVFAAAVVMLKIGDKRFMGRNTALDVMLGIVFGSVVGRAITGNAPLVPALAAGLALVVTHWALSAVAFRWRFFAGAVKGHERLLVRDGEIRWDEMRKGHVTEHDLEEALRLNGQPPDISRVREASLERNGDISVIMKE